MDTLPLPFYEVAALDDIAPGVKGLRILFVNVFALSADDGSGWTLIDTGLFLSAGKIRHWAENHFGKGTKPQAIILTHGHFDHVGTVKELVHEWKVPVYAHSAELPYLNGREKYPAPDPSVGGGVMATLSPFYPRTSVDLTGHVHALPEDHSAPNLPGWQWLHTPGHAPGHISLFRERDRVLLPGDAICTTKQESFVAVAKQRPELHGPPSYYTPNWDEARQSVAVLAALEPRTIAPHHGLPICGDEVPEQIRRLSTDFDRIAMPEHGKYVHRAATGGRA